MSAPKRIQRKRTKGWRMPEGAVYVGRPTKWGNPWTPENLQYVDDTTYRRATTAECVDLYRRELSCTAECPPEEHPWTAGLNVSELRGRDLACWCPLSRPCHADALLQLANA